MEIPSKKFFPLLPFKDDISYIMINESKKELSSDYSNSNEIFSNNDIFINNNNIPSGNYSIPHKKKKTFVKMTEDAENFKFSFYKMFTSKKKFPKKYVFLIHNELRKDLKLDRINRDECRSIDLYFLHFAKYRKDILLYLEKNKVSIIEKFPELFQILK